MSVARQWSPDERAQLLSAIRRGAGVDRLRSIFRTSTVAIERVLSDANVPAGLSTVELEAQRRQDEREVEFIKVVNACGGMPRTEIIGGVALAVNGRGRPWRLLRTPS